MYSVVKIKIEEEINTNLMLILYHYPQMTMAEYVWSMVNERIREEMVKQLRF